MNLLTTVEGYADEIGVDVETLLDTDYHAFLSAATPLYDDLKAFAVTTGKADLQQLLADLKSALVSAVTTVAANPLNAGTAIASVAASTLAKVAGDITGDAKNALYGALAIVATDVPQIVGTSTSSASGTSA